MTGIPAELGVQQKQRRGQEYTDQHGRTWWANIEIRTGHPTGGPIRPQFKAPWYPGSAYVTILPDSARKPWACQIDYERAITEHLEARRAWDQAVIKWGIEMNGQQFDRNAPSLEVLQRVGPRPVPAELYMACREGNRWILGLRAFNPDNEHDVRLRAFLEPVMQAGIPQVATGFGDVEEEDGAEEEEGQTVDVPRTRAPRTRSRRSA